VLAGEPERMLVTRTQETNVLEDRKTLVFAEQAAWIVDDGLRPPPESRSAREGSFSA